MQIYEVVYRDTESQSHRVLFHKNVDFQIKINTKQFHSLQLLQLQTLRYLRFYYYNLDHC